MCAANHSSSRSKIGTSANLAQMRGKVLRLPLHAVDPMALCKGKLETPIVQLLNRKPCKHSLKIANSLANEQRTLRSNVP